MGLCAHVLMKSLQALSALPTAAPLPSLPDWQFGTLQPQQQSIPFPADLHISSSLPDIDNDALLDALTGCQSVQDATGLGQSDLLRRLNGNEWSVDGAYKDCECRTIHRKRV